MRVRRLLLALVIALGGCAALSAPQLSAAPAGAAPLPGTVRADVLPAPQINGVVWKQAIAGNTVFAGGEFTEARPFGVAEHGPGAIAVTNLIAYDLTTGALDPSFRPTFDGVIRDMAVTPDQSKLVVVGDFTKVNDQPRHRVAVFDLPARSLRLTVKPDVNSAVYGVAVTNSRIWLGGNFSAVNGVGRSRLASVSAATGALLSLHFSIGGGRVTSVVVKPDGTQIAFGGAFTSVGGSSKPGFGMYRADAISGARLPLAANNLVRNAGVNSAIVSMSADDTSFYGAGYNFPVNGVGGNSEGVFQASWSTGALVTLDDCHGDSYGVAPIGDVVYVAGHKHNCTNSGGFPQTAPDWTNWHATAWTKAPQGTNIADTYHYPDHPGTPHGALLPYFPQFQIGDFTHQNQATWTVTGNAQYVLFGGEFTKVDGIAQQGIVRFGARAAQPDGKGHVGPITQARVGPLFQSGGAFTAHAVSFTPGEVRVSWPAVWDRDDLNLTYKVFRDGDLANPVCTKSADNWQWSGTQLTCPDIGLANGTSHSYVVRASDSDGNILNSGTVNATVATTNRLDPYAAAVIADAPSKYWRLNGSGAGAAVTDLAGPDYTTAGSGVTGGDPGAIGNGSTDMASTFDGTANAAAKSAVVSTNLTTGPDTFSEEVWFKTDSTTGGEIAGFGDAPKDNTSNHHDRQLSMDASGILTFGVAPGGKAYSVRDPQPLNDGQWHQAVATLGPNGMFLYVDGDRVGGSAAPTTGEVYGGYWRLGGDRTSFFTGSIDDYSVYPTALDDQKVRAHWVASGMTAGADPVAPHAFISSTAQGRRVAFRGAGTSTEATIASYAWNFGDGTKAATQNPVHTYARPGTYTATLTVTDARGYYSSTTRTRTVVNARPHATFTASVRRHTVTFHGGRSSDPDGRIVSYVWHFGDRKTARGATVRHTYSKTKRYRVTLIVTDNSRARTTVAHTITTKRR